MGIPSSDRAACVSPFCLKQYGCLILRRRSRVGYTVALWRKEEKRERYAVRIRTREFQYPRSISQQALACFQRSKKEPGVDILQASKSRVAQPCRGRTGSHGDGRLPGDVCGLPPEIRSHGPRHLAK